MPQGQEAKEVPLALATSDLFTLGGRLKHFWDRWSDPFICHMLKFGLTWDWLNSVPPVFSRPLWRATDPRLALGVQEMVKLSVIIEHPLEEILFCGHIFERPKPNGKLRLILDISELNIHISNSHFQMLKLADIPLWLQKDHFLVSIDLTSAYWHIPVNADFQKYLGFQYQNKSYVFQAMPFGLNIAPRIFTRLMLDIIKYLTSLNIFVIIYLDDILVMAKDRETLLLHRNLTLYTLKHFGLIVNLEKSSLCPQQEIVFLGLTWNTRHMTVWLGNTLILKIHSKLNSILLQNAANLKEVQSLMGSLVHASFVVIDLKPLIMHLHHVLLLPRFKSKTRCTVIDPLFRDIHKEIIKVGFLQQKMSLTPQAIASQVAVDASLNGWGAVMLTAPETVASGIWDNKEKHLPIVYLEAKAILKALTCFPHLSNQQVMLFSDSKPVVGCLNKGGSTKSMKLNNIIQKIWYHRKTANLSLRARHVRGKHNILADTLSRRRQVHTGEWSLTPKCFKWICQLGFSPEIDLFSTDWNKQLPLYCTLHHSLLTPLQDAMSLDWNRWKVIFLFPPPF